MAKHGEARPLLESPVPPPVSLRGQASLLKQQAQNGALLLNNDVLELRELQKLRYAYASSRALFGALCVFDALAATGLWAVLEERLHGKIVLSSYDFTRSIIDIAGVAIARFLLCTSIYSFGSVSVLWPMLAVALVSFVFYGVKIYMTHYEQPPKFEPTDIVLYVQGCVLCVCELWFLHARVMPGHTKIGEAVSAIRHSKMHPASNAEATTLSTMGKSDPVDIKRNVYEDDDDLPDDASSGYHTPGGYATPAALSDAESDMYGTPQSSRESSPAQFNNGGAFTLVTQPDPALARPIPSKSASRHQTDEQLAKTAADAVARTWTLATSNEINWTIEAQRGAITVWSIVRGATKILMSDGEVKASPSVLFHLLHKNIQSHTKWNPMLSRYEVIKPIDHYTDMTYTETRSMAGGLISPRDFVNVRRWMKRDGNVVIAEVKAEHQSKPPTEDNIRGQYGPGGYVLLSIKDRPHVTRVMWLINIDFKGWLPRYLVDQTMSNLLIEHHDAVAGLVDMSGGSRSNSPAAS